MGNSDQGLHAATQGGLWQSVVNGFAGFRIQNDLLCLEPSLPAEWQRVRFAFTYQGMEIVTIIEKSRIVVRVQAEQFRPVTVRVWGKMAVINSADCEIVWVK